ncbi:MAG: hydroxymethylglutaryl-CoA lyase [Bacteroidetes bacterium B1(2017)]|nr:MAG: hydroxymethylglutaryl-CoA lyase [Bacteroidetes bacterium B1(2017)]
MQGLHNFIPTEIKVQYLNQLLEVGFDTLDFGSFVSPKAIPQLRDTTEVLAQLNLEKTRTKLLAIVANLRGAEEACKHPQIKYLGFPFSISETFQQRNTNSSIQDSLMSVEQMQNLCVKHNKELVVYISMGFGNPYGDDWNADLVAYWVQKMDAMGIRILSLSDTIGIADPKSISYIFTELIERLPHIEFGAHLHTTPNTWEEKVAAAWESGCRRFDGALKGFGGCPMATDTLTGNMPTENILSFLEEKGVESGLNLRAFEKSMGLTNLVFSQL